MKILLSLFLLVSSAFAATETELNREIDFLSIQLHEVISLQDLGFAGLSRRQRHAFARAENFLNLNRAQIASAYRNRITALADLIERATRKRRASLILLMLQLEENFERKEALRSFLRFTDSRGIDPNLTREHITVLVDVAKWEADIQVIRTEKFKVHGNQAAVSRLLEQMTSLQSRQTGSLGQFLSSYLPDRPINIASYLITRDKPDCCGKTYHSRCAQCPVLLPHRRNNKSQGERPVGCWESLFSSVRFTKVSEDLLLPQHRIAFQLGISVPNWRQL